MLIVVLTEKFTPEPPWVTCFLLFLLLRRCAKTSIDYFIYLTTRLDLPHAIEGTLHVRKVDVVALKSKGSAGVWAEAHRKDFVFPGRSHGCCPVRVIGVNFHEGFIYLLPELRIKMGLMVLLQRPTAIQFQSSIIYIPMDNIPLCPLPIACWQHFYYFTLLMIMLHP